MQCTFHDKYAENFLHSWGHQPHLNWNVQRLSLVYMRVAQDQSVPEIHPCATLKVEAAYVLPWNHKVPSNAPRGVVPGPCNRDLLLIPVVVLSLHLSSVAPL